MKSMRLLKAPPTAADLRSTINAAVATRKFVVQNFRHRTLARGSRPMETGLPESIPVFLGQEDDGRWWAEMESVPGVMA